MMPQRVQVKEDVVLVHLAKHQQLLSLSRLGDLINLIKKESY